MPISRKLYANAAMKDRLDRRFRGVNNTSNIANNDDEEKRRILKSFDSKKVDELLKRQKFAPEADEETIIDQPDQPDQPELTYCELYESDQIFDTGFEGGCNYFGYLTLLGPFAIFENFETRNDDDVGGEIFNVSLFNYVEDFEDDSISGDLVWFGELLDPTSFSLVYSDDTTPTITLNWVNDNDFDPTVTLERRIVGEATWNTLTTVSGVTTYVDIDNITPDEEYEYRIQFEYEGSNSNYVTG